MPPDTSCAPGANAHMQVAGPQPPGQGLLPLQGHMEQVSSMRSLVLRRHPCTLGRVAWELEIPTCMARDKQQVHPLPHWPLNQFFQNFPYNVCHNRYKLELAQLVLQVSCKEYSGHHLTHAFPFISHYVHHPTAHPFGFFAPPSRLPLAMHSIPQTLLHLPLQLAAGDEEGFKGGLAAVVASSMERDFYQLQKLEAVAEAAKVAGSLTVELEEQVGAWKREMAWGGTGLSPDLCAELRQQGPISCFCRCWCLAFEV